MARSIPVGRLEHLVDCATSVFIDQGYRRTQMADVADALGVAKGTLYLYVESKEALVRPRGAVCRLPRAPSRTLRRCPFRRRNRERLSTTCGSASFRTDRFLP